MVRVRFAPSPTGFLHIGLVRTAVFNWLFARKNKGKFIIRIEDTDEERSFEESIKIILDGISWLGLDWDEGPIVGGNYGPYAQSQRQHIYKEYINKLLENGSAYKCFCSEEEINRKREEAQKNKKPYKYDRKCLNSDVSKFINTEQNFAIRFKVPDGETSFNDLIRGKVKFSNSTIGDFIIARSDGKPTYNLCVAVDDYLMKISHVIRGEDHISNTPKQIMIYNALKVNIPEFAHIPLTLSANGAKLSKRSGEASFQKYIDEGFLPEAMLNFIVFLGWNIGKGDTREILSKDELIKEFSLSGISSASATFNLSKLEWLNGKYIRASSSNTIVEKAIPFLIRSKLISEETLLAEKDKIANIILLFKDRLKKFSEICELSNYFFLDDIEYDEKAVKKFLKTTNIKNILEDLLNLLSSISEFTLEELKSKIEKYIIDSNLKLGEVLQPLRVCITGKDASPPLYDVLYLLGKEKVLKRLKFVLDNIIK